METRWGKRFGRYEILTELGRGAMGIVYKARDPKIDRFVAVKTISLSTQNAEEQREYRERFFHEAQAAGRLLHPGIVTIFDTGEDPESHTAYIVMEYVAGQSLDRLLSGTTNKLPLDTALRLTEELAEALDHAHCQGVVHRDMKPANILVTRDGHAKIADFGIAKLNLGQLTLPGRALGTPAYMSPEQLEGESVDNRSDLFSLGAILYRMVTGYGPFQGNSATTVCFKVANRDPLRATALNSDLPPELDAIIARAIAKDRAQRYQRGLEFALDVRELRTRSVEQTARNDNGTPLISRDGEDAEQSGSDAGDGVASTRLMPPGFFEVPGEVSGIRPASSTQSLHSRRSPLLPVAMVFLLAALVLGFVVHRRSRQVQSSKRTATSVAVGGSGEPAAAGNAPLHITSAAKPVADSALDMRIEHHFSGAELSLWIDDKLAYDHALHAQAKKHWNPFRGTAQENETVRLAAGQHRLRVRLRSTSDKYEQSATILGSFAKGHPTILLINFDKQGKGMRLALR